MRGAPHITSHTESACQMGMLLLRSTGFRRFGQGGKPSLFTLEKDDEGWKNGERGLRGFQLDPEAAALAGSGFDADFSAHALGSAADNRQAQATAFVTAGVIHALEHLE